MAVVAVTGAVAVAVGRADDPVEIRVRHSRFLPAGVAVPVGRPVTFVLVNDDPIDHEWIVGDDGVHQRHRTGREPVHAERPTEVTVPAGETRRTTVVFPEAGLVAVRLSPPRA